MASLLQVGGQEPSTSLHQYIHGLAAVTGGLRMLVAAVFGA
jgi:hypothetical protein